MKPLIYIATPYTGKEIAGVQKQMDTFHELMNMGLTPFAPLLCHFVDQYKPRTYEEWLDYCLDIIPRCDALLAMHGLSYGVEREIAFATSEQIPIYNDTVSLVQFFSGESNDRPKDIHK